jgi:hypothetical protein
MKNFFLISTSWAVAKNQALYRDEFMEFTEAVLEADASSG